MRCKLRTELHLAVARPCRHLRKPWTRGRCPYLGTPLRCRRAASPLVSPPSRLVSPPSRLTLSKLPFPIRPSQSRHIRQGVSHLCRSRTGAPRSLGPPSRNCPCGIRREPPWRIPSTNEAPAQTSTTSVGFDLQRRGYRRQMSPLHWGSSSMTVVQHDSVRCRATAVSSGYLDNVAPWRCTCDGGPCGYSVEGDCMVNTQQSICRVSSG